ncbi:hypothetical protein EHM92_04275, partial [bacterium]
MRSKFVLFPMSRRLLFILLLISISVLPRLLRAQERSNGTGVFTVRQGGLRLSPEQLIFASTAVGDSTPGFFTVHNDSLRSVLVTAVRGRGRSFHADPPLPLEVPAGAAVMIRVVYTPRHFGRTTDTLTVLSELGEGKIALRGRSPFPVVLPDRETLDFDSVARRTSSEQAIVIGNPSINALAIDSVWTHSSFFHPLVRQASVPGADSVAIVVAFAPVFSGSFADTLFIQSNARERIVEIPLGGWSPPPVLAVSTEEIRFAQTSITDSIVSQIRLVDASISSLNLQSVRTAGFGFHVHPVSVPSAIRGNDTVTVSVIFRPRDFGEFVDTVTIESDGGTARIPLRGKSPYPILITSIDTLAFGDVRKGAAARRSIIIRNPSLNILRLDSIYTRTKWFAARVPKMAVRATDSLALEAVFIPDHFRNYSDT